MSAPEIHDFTYSVNQEQSTASMRIIAVRVALPASPTIERTVVVVGSDHDHDPSPELTAHPKYVLGANLLQNWLEQTSDHADRRRIIYEGRDCLADDIPDLAAALVQGGGEPGLLQYFAQSHNIKAVSGEPPLTEELRVMLIRNNPVAVSTFLGLRFIPWIKKSYGTHNDISSYFSQYTDILKDISFENFVAGFRATFGLEFIEEDYRDHSNPIIEQCTAITKDFYTNPELLDTIDNPRLKRLAEISLTVQNTRSRNLGSAVVKAAVGAETRSMAVVDSHFGAMFSIGPAYTNPNGASFTYNANTAESVFAWYGGPHIERIGGAVLRLGIPYDPVTKHMPQHRQDTAIQNENRRDYMRQSRFGLGNLLLPLPQLNATADTITSRPYDGDDLF